jgi:hypothetical protein
VRNENETVNQVYDLYITYLSLCSGGRILSPEMKIVAALLTVAHTIWSRSNEEIQSKT